MLMDFFIVFNSTTSTFYYFLRCYYYFFYYIVHFLCLTRNKAHADRIRVSFILPHLLIEVSTICFILWKLFFYTRREEKNP